jgi:glycine betaine/proline transport system permease protein
MTDTTPPGLNEFIRERRDMALLAAVIVVLLISIVVAGLSAGSYPFPGAVADNFPFAEWVNDGEAWLKDNYRWLTRAIAGAVGDGLDRVELFLLLMPWPVSILAVALMSLWCGGLRLSLFCIAVMLFWGTTGMWDSAMTTLSLMAVSVVLSATFGVLLGIAASQNDRVEAIVRPILDTMQTMPSFVYLIPAIFFFGVGGPPAILATVIYALPPAVRLTNLGIRQVPAETLEAARSYGSTPLQLLIKVKLPLALPSIMMGINQTVMMALGMVVIATFIGAGGLGYEVWQALRNLNIGWSLEGGLSIVFMAIIFDRISYALSAERASGAEHHRDPFRLLPSRLEDAAWARAFERALGAACEFCRAASRLFAQGLAAIVGTVLRPISRGAAESLGAFIRNHAFFAAGATLVLAVYLIDSYLVSYGDFPRAWRFSIREPADAALDWLKVNETFITVTTWIRYGVFSWLLDPLADFLVALPWWYTIALVTGIMWLSAGRWLALVTLAALIFIGAVGLWETSMLTLATILVSVFLCFLFGVPLGIAMACNDVFEAIMKPVLDAMQTMPPFVYLVPVLMFFGGNVVSAVIATCVYAIPPLVRLTNLGIREVPGETVESARSFGSTFLQTLTKVRMPLALPSIMMGVNQALCMALAMSIITPLIGGGGLGEEVFNALARVNTGKGLQAGLSIVFLAIILDRLTQAWSQNRRISSGVQ